MIESELAGIWKQSRASLTSEEEHFNKIQKNNAQYSKNDTFDKMLSS